MVGVWRAQVPPLQTAHLTGVPLDDTIEHEFCLARGLVRQFLDVCSVGFKGDQGLITRRAVNTGGSKGRTCEAKTALRWGKEFTEAVECH